MFSVDWLVDRNEAADGFRFDDVDVNVDDESMVLEWASGGGRGILMMFF